jgi:spore maturation protein CgeB
MLDALISAGLRVRVFGPHWDRFAAGRKFANLARGPVLGAQYALAIAAAKIGLVFLSKRNRDQYTRRCFEIPAIGTMMLAPRTDELRSLFEEDRDAVYFSSVDELVTKARIYAADDERRHVIAANGRRRCIADRHHLVGRAHEFLAALGLEAQNACRDQFQVGA